MKNVRTKHQRLFGTTLIALSAAILVNRCGLLEYAGECWSESIPALIGGTLLATEGTMHLTQLVPPKPQTVFAISDAILPEAQAASYCPTLDSFSGVEVHCLTPIDYPPYFTAGGPVLEVRYNSCKFGNRSEQVPGYWYGAQRLTINGDLATATAKCAAIVAAGTITPAALDGFTVKRHFGESIDGTAFTSGQDTFRLAQNNEVAALWSDYPSGWYDPSPKGGIDIAFSGSTRTLTIKGVHARAYNTLSHTRYTDTADGTPWSFLDVTDYTDLDNLVLNTDYRINWDHTIDTPADETFTTNTSDISAKTYSTITVTGTGSSRTVTAMSKVRMQHNMANIRDPRTYSYSYLPTGQTLTWAEDPNCCWPTSGKIQTVFVQRNGLNPRPDWKAEEIEFSSTCGSVNYKAYLTVDEATGLPTGDADYSVTHQLTHCY